jgi:hypothetical protein
MSKIKLTFPSVWKEDKNFAPAESLIVFLYPAPRHVTNWAIQVLQTALCPNIARKCNSIHSDLLLHMSTHNMPFSLNNMHSVVILHINFSWIIMNNIQSLVFPQICVIFKLKMAESGWKIRIYYLNTILFYVCCMLICMLCWLLYSIFSKMEFSLHFLFGPHLLLIKYAIRIRDPIGKYFFFHPVRLIAHFVPTENKIGIQCE